MTQLRKRRRAASVLLAVLILGTLGLWIGSNYLASISAVNVSYTSRVQPEGTIVLQVYETASSVGFFRQSAQRLLHGKTGDADRLNALLDWTYDSVRPPYAAPNRLVSDNAYSIIRRGFGYCDQSAHVFATLAHYAGYDVRLLFLLRADGVSPHTVAQVLVGGRWVVADAYNGVLWHDDNGKLLTVDELRTTPDLLERLGYGTQGLEAADFFRGTVFQSFPYADANLVLAKIKGRLQRAPIAPTSAAPPRAAASGGDRGALGESGHISRSLTRADRCRCPAGPDGPLRRRATRTVGRGLRQGGGYLPTAAAPVARPGDRRGGALLPG